MSLWLVLSSVALAGYGDAVDGRPSRDEREIHLWTNAVRVDPEGFAPNYACDYATFSADEQTAKTPLLWNDALSEVARIHTQDMKATGVLSHDSSDGTPWDVRIGAYYDSSTIAENVAQGYGSPWAVVIEGWMCSTEGHRATILSSSYDELGVGAVGTWYTEDFGLGGVAPRAIAMGVHIPANPTGQARLLADYRGTAAPDRFDAVVDGEAVAMAAVYGTVTNGLWQGLAEVGDGCHQYYFLAESDGVVTTFPETGSYGWGDCAFADPEAGWQAAQMPAPPAAEPADTDAKVDPGCGCETSELGSALSVGLLVGLSAFRARRAARS